MKALERTRAPLCRCLHGEDMSHHYAPSADVLAWFQSAGFVRCAEHSESWEIAYGLSHGYITLRFYPHDFGWDVIVETGHSDERRGLNLGMCQTLARMQDVWACLGRFDYEHQPHGEFGGFVKVQPELVQHISDQAILERAYDAV